MVSELDTAHSIYHAARKGEGIRQAGADAPSWPAEEPKELAPVYVMLASDEASYVSGATVAVTGGKPII